MRLIRVEIENFGPFAGKPVEIDFTRVERLFLVAGDTGAGKTSLFDAVCYALYGKPLGTRREAGVSLRSQLAAEDSSTWVRLVFECGGQRWRIHRSPYAVRPKKRGTGVTQPEEVAVLWQWTGLGTGEDGWTVMPQKGQELNRRIAAEIVRLGYEDFSTVLVLPQGEFQQFLEMESDARRKTLEKLFPIQHHKRLVELAGKVRKECGEKLSEIDVLLEDAGRAHRPAEFQDHQAKLQSEIVERQRSADDAFAAEKVAAQAFQDGRALEQSFLELVAAEEQLGRLRAQAEAMAASRRERDAAQGALRLAGWLEQHATVAADRRNRSQRASEIAAALERLAAERESLQPRVTQIPERKLAISADEERLRRAQERRQDLGELRKAVRDHVQKKQAAEQRRAAVPARLDRVKAAQEQLGAIEALVPVLQEMKERAAGEAVALAQLGALKRDAMEALAFAGDAGARLRASVAQSAQALQVAQAQETAADLAAAAARSARDADAASLLAARLMAGDPCPVCGSREHPAPASSSSASGVDGHAAVRTAEERSAESRRARERCERACESAKQALADADQRAAAAAQVLRDAGFATVASWQDAVRDRQTGLDRLRAELARLDGRLAERDRLQVALRERESELRKAEEAVVAADKEVHGCERFEDGLRQRTGPVDDLDAAEADAQAEAVAAKQAALAGQRWLAELESQVRTNENRYAEAARESKLLSDDLVRLDESFRAIDAKLQDELRQTGFASAQEATRASRTTGQIAALTERIESWERELNRTDDRRSMLVERTEGRVRPDVAALAKARDERGEFAKVALAAAEQARRELKDLQDARTRWEELLARREELIGRNRAMIALAGDLAGDNHRNLDFPTFVLTGWLDQVLARANVRLRRLSSGRYGFIRQSDAVDLRKGAGLDIDVSDAYSGGRRSVSTLSGGEKFMASLSLALGLSDVIQERRGGIELDTLFIDEGFGSLDAEALDRALAVLDEIGAHRTVGVISHVEAMKAVIPCRIQVDKGPAGSRVTLKNGSCDKIAQE